MVWCSVKKKHRDNFTFTEIMEDTMDQPCAFVRKNAYGNLIRDTSGKASNWKTEKEIDLTEILYEDVSRRH
jgi:hypothetical protein